MKRLYRVTMMMALSLFGIALAQDPEIGNPGGWFVNPDVLAAAGAMLAGYVVNLLTALGKHHWLTTGNRTRILSIALSVVIAGVGGYLSLGYLSDLSGFQGAIRAAVMTAVALVLANAQYHANQQAAAKGAEAAAAKAKLLK